MVNQYRAVNVLTRDKKNDRTGRKAVMVAPPTN